MHSSSSHDSDKNSAVKPDIYYTTEDVQFLHEVVAHAQDLLPGLPERDRVPTNALFTAYYALLPTIGVHADHDSRYARILFRIGGTRSAGSLFEKFEIVLGQMGIDLEFEQQQDEEIHQDKVPTRAHEASPLQTEVLPPETAASPLHRYRQRRNSEGSMWDVGGHHRTNQHSRTRSQSPHVIPGTGVSTAGRGLSVSPATTSIGHNYNFRPDPRKQGQDREDRSRLNRDNSHYPLLTKRTTSFDSVKDLRRSPQLSEYDSRTTSTWPGSNDEDAAFASMGQTAPTSKTADSDLGYSNAPISDTLTDIKASLLHQYRTKNMSRHAVALWRQATLQVREDNENLELLAAYQDKQVLLRQAFDSWQANARTRQQTAETERFFAHLEGRANRARNYMILSKAFIHWIANAYDESLKTAAARRHILRTRYFEAWHGLTAVNELKVRRHILRKFFEVWHGRHNSNNSKHVKGLTVFKGNLAQRVFQTWLSELHEREASAWCLDRIKRSKLTRWITATDRIVTNQTTAIKHDHWKLGNSCLLAWMAKSRQCIQYGIEADEHRVGMLNHKVLQQLGLEHSLFAPARRLNALISLRLKRKFAAVWLQRSRQERRATAVDQLKVKREAWVAWNNSIRFHIISARVNRNLLLKGFRSWMLLERTILSERLSRRKAAQSALYVMAAASQALIDTEVRNLHHVNMFAYEKLTQNAVTAWRALNHTQVSQWNMACELRSPRLIGNSLTTWTERAKQNAQLHKWARDAEFYFVANKTLKLWNAAAESSKREKRRGAYVEVRRKRKLNLATSVLSHWRLRKNTVLTINDLSAEFLLNRTTVLGIDIFHRWKDLAEQIRALESTSEQLQLRKHLENLRVFFSARHNLLREADALFSERNAVLGVKMWTRAALHLRASRHVLSELREKHNKKTLRKIIIHWRQRASAHMSLLQLGQKDIPLDVEPNILGATQRAETWSEYGIDPDIDEWARGLDDEYSGSTIPGYLSTPSKKMSRARTFGSLSSTTPVAPLSTPIERHLRDQYAGGSLPFRRAIGKSLLGKDREAAYKASLTGRNFQSGPKS